MASRPKQLIYQGAQVPLAMAEDGTVTTWTVDRYFPGVPARDLDEGDIANLSDAQLDEITADPKNGQGPLYVVKGEPVPEPKTRHSDATVDELRAEADARGIDLGGARKRDEIVERLESGPSVP